MNTTTTQQVKEENPDMKITEMSKVLGARWREMDEKQKAPYQKKADADKARLVNHQSSGYLFVILIHCGWLYRSSAAQPKPSLLRSAPGLINASFGVRSKSED